LPRNKRNTFLALLLNQKGKVSLKRSVTVLIGLN